MKSILSLFPILITSLIVLIQVTTSTEFDRSPLVSLRSHWLTNSHQDRDELLQKLYESKRIDPSHLSRSTSPLEILHSSRIFKGTEESLNIKHNSIDR